MDIKSIKIAKLCKVSQKTTDKIIKNIRILIVKECEKISKIQGEIEIGESCFLFCYTCNYINRRSYAKHRLSKFRGISKNNFILHLKETEFRYNTKIAESKFIQKTFIFAKRKSA